MNREFPVVLWFCAVLFGEFKVELPFRQPNVDIPLLIVWYVYIYLPTDPECLEYYLDLCIV